MRLSTASKAFRLAIFSLTRREISSVQNAISSVLCANKRNSKGIQQTRSVHERQTNSGLQVRIGLSIFSKHSVSLHQIDGWIISTADIGSRYGTRSAMAGSCCEQ